MEFHSGGVQGNLVEIMCCTDDMCRQIKVAVENGSEADIEKRVEGALTSLYAKIGEACLKFKSLAEIEAQLGK
jgi:hypothetical protein